MLMVQEVQQRSLRDLLAEERRLRDLSDRARKAYVKLLGKLAQKLLGEELEEARRQDPHIPQSWTVPDWEAFFGHLERHRSSSGSGWKRSNGKASARLKEALAHSQSEIKALKAQVTRLKQEAQKAPFEPVSEAVFKPEQETEPPKAENRPDPEDKRGNPLVGFTTPKQPLAFEAAFRESAWTKLRWRRGAMMLYLLATYGFNAHLEFDMLIAPVEELSYRTNSTKKPLKLLAQSGFAVVETLWIRRQTFRMALKLAHLTEKGRKLCQMMGWEAVESEWERLKRLHEGERFEEHTLAVLYFALHARARGWTARVLPEVKGAAPDIALTKGGQQVLVEVELGGRDRPAKWRKLADVQGEIALCALDPPGRKRLVADCKLTRLSGQATDLLSLQKQAKIYHLTQETPLWLESW